MSVENAILDLAVGYLNQKLSVIPCKGKQPAIKWQRFNSKRPGLIQIKNWFENGRYLSIGIVCGQISNRRIVIDIDSHQTHIAFVNRFPNLLNTYTIQTAGRGLPHYHFEVEESDECKTSLPTMRGNGVDLLGDNAIVIMPPSRINDNFYTVTNDVPVRKISTSEYQELQEFVRLARNSSPFETIEEVKLHHFDDGTDALKKLHSQWQKNLRTTKGRNNALFKTCLWARDHGLHANTVLDHVLPYFVELRSPSGHTSETRDHRIKEGYATIRSAYSRRPRTVQPTTINYLSNLLREAMLQVRDVATLRVFEALILNNTPLGTYLTKKQLASVCRKHNVGDYSLRKFLFWVETAKISPGNATHVEKTSQDNNDLCKKYLPHAWYVSENQQKRKRGRPSRYYRIPTVIELCNYYGVDINSKHSTPITSGALSSKRQYRLLLHKDYIRRMPGKHRVAALSGRLGISRTTLHEYNHLADIHVLRDIEHTRVSWGYLDRIRFRSGSLWDGFKHYPAKRSLAAYLLAQGRTLIHLKEVNHYSVEPVLNEIEVSNLTPECVSPPPIHNKQSNQSISGLSSPTVQPSKVSTPNAIPPEVDVNQIQKLFLYGYQSLLDCGEDNAWGIGYGINPASESRYHIQYPKLVSWAVHLRPTIARRYFEADSRYRYGFHAIIKAMLRRHCSNDNVEDLGAVATPYFTEHSVSLLEALLVDFRMRLKDARGLIEHHIETYGNFELIEQGIEIADAEIYMGKIKNSAAYLKKIILELEN